MSRPLSQFTDIQESTLTTVSEPAITTGSNQDALAAGPRRASRRMLVWGALSLIWIGYLALGQVNARFWVLGDFRTDFKPIRSIWRIQLGSLPGGDSAWMIQALVLTAIIVFVLGVIAGLYLLLIPADTSSES
jgi:hypothetical protein